MNTFLFIINLLIIGSITFFIWRKNRSTIFWPALFFKVSCGILLGLLYKYYYTSGDTWTFFFDGATLVNILSAKPVQLFSFLFTDDIAFEQDLLIDTQPRSFYFLKWVSIFNLIGGNNYWITSLYFSLISFFGSWYFYQTLNKHFPSLRLEIAASILFVPSLIFWSSGIIKESLALGSLFILSSVFLDWFLLRTINRTQLLLVAISFWILWSIKYYWLTVWMGVATPTVLISLLKSKVGWINQNRKWLWLIFLMASLFGLSFIRSNFNYDKLFFVIAENHDAYITFSDHDDVIHYYDLSPSGISILRNSPLALLSGLFRPFFFEAGNILQLAASIENLVLLILFGFSVYRFRIYSHTLDILHLSLLFYTIILALFLTLSTPNFGTLSRYKIAYTPFLWLTLLSGSGLLRRFYTPKTS